MIEGLSYARRVGRIFVIDSRVARQDSDQGFGHQSQLIYTASLAANVLPTLSHTAAYSGQSIWTSQGFANNNSFSLYSRAAPWRGIGLLAGGTYSLNRNANGSLLRADSATFTGSFQPHQSVTCSITYGHSDTSISGLNAQQSTSSAANRVDSSLTFNPFPALYLSGGVSRVVIDGVPHVLDNANVTFSPFPGGNLQLGVSYAETYQDGQLSRLFSPSVRWNVRPGTMLTVSYLLLDSNTAGAGANHTRTFDVNLQIAL
jgi:hypothetical protein